MLERGKWQIFQRLALHLLRRFPHAAPVLVAERLTDRGLFDDHCLWHEYFLLAREQFPNLRPNQQAEILNWIAIGPEVKRFIEWWETEKGTQPTNEQIGGDKNRWRLERLAPLREVLPPDWRAEYDRLVAELEAPEHPEFLH